MNCSQIEQFLLKLKLVAMETVIGLKGVRITSKEPKLECVAFSDTIIEV